MGFEEYFQPPFSVFFLWAIFLGIIVLFQPIKACVKKLCACFGCTCCAAVETEEGDDELGDDANRPGDYYGHLSADRKLEIDNLRTMAILRYLAKFTLTLKDENMTSRESTNRRVSVDLVTESKDNDNITSINEDERDIESGFPNEEDSKMRQEANLEALEYSSKLQQASHLEVMECTGEHTHILIPLPGHTNDDEEVVKSETTEPAAKATWHPHLPRIKSPQDKPNNDEEPAQSAEPIATERAVPIFCAVCLMEYEVAERVCWSSNKECTHVFHEDCIVQWLVSSGRTKSKRQWFPENPSEKRLMCYELECPCCRQEFISKEARVPETTEENSEVGTTENPVDDSDRIRSAHIFARSVSVGG